MRDCKSSAFGRVFRLLLAAFLIVHLASPLAALNEAQVPPRPDIPPTVTYPFDLDSDLDRLDDLLQQRLAALRARIAAEPDAQVRAGLMQELEVPVTVETLFSEPITERDLDAFLRVGGKIRYVFKHVSYGWWGEIPLGAVERVPGVMGRTFLALVAARPVHALMDEATRTGRVRPVWAAGFAGYGSGFSGNSSTSIAVLDSGVDGTHTDLAGRMVYWKDWIYSSPTPTDVNGHGSHVAGIALGTGAASGTNPTTLLYTDSEDASSLGYGYFYPSPIHIRPGSASMQMTATFQGGGQADLGYLYADNGVDTWSGPSPSTGTSPLSATYNFTATSARRYSVYFAKAGGTITQYGVTVTATTAGLGDGFNLLRGVAPGVNWVGERILDNSGSGNTSTWGAAMDDCVANRQTYNIKVANMSVGTYSPYSPIRDKVNTMAANGIVPVAAAGNDGPSGVITDPGRARLALTVGASSDVNVLTDYTSNGNFSQEANTDYKPDLLAPGGSWYQSLIMSVDSNTADAGSSSFSDLRANDYANYGGTSMASPFAAGTAALVIQALEAGGLSWSYSSDAHPRLVKMLLCATATETNANREAGGSNPTLGRAATPKDNYEGYGLINADAAVEAAYKTIAPGETINDTTAGGQFDRRAWGRKIALTNGVQVTLNLTVPATGDYDLYLYSATPDTNGNPVRLASSTGAGAGVSESIVYTPAATGTAYLVIKRVSGSGAWSLTYTGGSASITVTSPSGGENWAIGSTHSVTWTYTGSPGANVAVELLKGGSLDRTLIASTPLGSGGSGSWSWTLADDLAPAGDYRIRVKSTTTSASDTSDADFSVGKAPTTTTVAASAGKIGETVNLQATLTRNTDGAPLASRTIAFQVEGSSIGSASTNGSGVATKSYVIPEALGTGGKTVRADFGGDAAHLASFGTATLTVSKGDTALAVADKSGQIGATITLSATLTCVGNGLGVSGRAVDFSVDGTGVGSETTNGSGLAEAAYAIPVAGGPGSRTIAAGFAGDAAYNGASGSGTLTVLKADVSLAVANVSGAFNAGVTLSAVLTRATDSVPLDGRTVAFQVEGTGVGDGTTDGSGTAETPYTIPEALGRGNKTIQAEFAGDANHNAGVGTGTLTVIGWPTALTVGDAAGMVSETVVLSANLVRSDTLAPLAGRTVSFTVQGTAAGSGTTDGSGNVTVNYAIPDTVGSGALILQAHFDGDGDHEPCDGTGTLTVTKAGTSLYVLDRTGIITEQITLRAYLRRLSDSANVVGRTVAFTVDGTGVGSSVTGATGRADLNWTITAGAASRPIGAEFAGDDAYTGSTGSATLTAITWATKMAGFNRTAKIAGVTELKARLLRSDNTPLYNRTINFYVDGTFVISRPTNTSGYASYPYYHVPDGSGAGTRTILSEWPGNAGYLASSANATLTVQKATPYIWVMPRSVPVGGVARFYAYFRRLPDYQKQEGKTVSFKVDGTWIVDVVTGTGADAGIARYNYTTVEPPGSHTLRCEFAGDAWVDAGYGEATLTIY
jgi:subtilisin family serine protease